MKVDLQAMRRLVEGDPDPDQPVAAVTPRWLAAVLQELEACRQPMACMGGEA